MTGKQAYGAWVAVITTLIGALTAHTAAQRYEQLVVTYRATAERLDGMIARLQSTREDPRELIERCEAILLEENQGWVAGANEMIKDSSAATDRDTVSIEKRSNT